MNDVFSADLWTVLLVMLVGGIIGGTVNFFYAPVPGDQPNSLGRCVILGIGASALVPVFLFVTQSKILDKLFNPVQAGVLTESEKAINMLVFIGLCLLAAISSARFIASVSDRVIAQLEKKVEQNAEEIEKTKSKVEAVETDAHQAGETAAATEEKTRENKESIRALKDMQRSRILTGAGASGRAIALANEPRLNPPPVSDRPLVADDPQKGRWGGQPTRSSCQLSALVRAVDSDNDFFRVLLRVTAPDSMPLPAGSTVVFHLHSTFRPPVRSVVMDQHKAALELVAWGAFTVGAVLPDGTELELDLSDPTDVPDAPLSFRSL